MAWLAAVRPFDRLTAGAADLPPGAGQGRLTRYPLDSTGANPRVTGSLEPKGVAGYDHDVLTIWELLGHRRVQTQTAMSYGHVLRCGREGI